MKSKAAVFLNGTYPPEHNNFYIDVDKRCRSDSIVIVTDGGLKFFIDNNIHPDIITGDLDSVSRESIELFSSSKVITTSSDNKTLTDGEMALEWCVKNHIKDVMLCGGIDTSFETDHLLGNIFMMFAFKDKFNSINMRDYCQEIIPIENETYSGKGKPGDTLSVIPVSDDIVYEADGLKYDPSGKLFKFGQTEPLRNELTESMFTVNIKGRAVLIRQF